MPKLKKKVVIKPNECDFLVLKKVNRCKKLFFYANKEMLISIDFYKTYIKNTLLICIKHSFFYVIIRNVKQKYWVMSFFQGHK